MLKTFSQIPTLCVFIATIKTSLTSSRRAYPFTVRGMLHYFIISYGGPLGKSALLACYIISLSKITKAKTLGQK